MRQTHPFEGAWRSGSSRGRQSALGLQRAALKRVLYLGGHRRQKS